MRAGRGSVVGRAETKFVHATGGGALGQREPTALRHRANGLNQGQGPGPNEASARVGARQEQRADHGDQSLTAKRDGLRCAPVPQSLPVRRRSCRVPACRAACLAVGLGCLMAPRGGWGYAVEADATVIGQGYSLRTADVLPSTVNRRRLTTYLGLRVEDIALGGRASDLQPPARNELAMVVELRVDADFGDYLCSIGRVSMTGALGCLDSSRGGSRTDPELSNYRPELMQAYVEGRRLWGWVNVRLGRQLTWDLLDLRGLDGVWLSAQTPLYFAVDAWGGLSQNGALPIDPAGYVLDGTSRSVDRLPTDVRQQSTALQPTIGLTARLTGVRDVQARISYRRTQSTTMDLLPAGCAQTTAATPCAPSWGTIEDRLAGSTHVRLLQGRVQIWGALRYDLLSGRMDDAQAMLRAALDGRSQHILTSEYRYSVPTWDGDSIWNVFSTDPYHHGQLGYDGRKRLGSGSPPRAPLINELSWSLRGHARLFVDTPGSAGAAGGGASAWSGGADAALRYRRSTSSLRVFGFVDLGYGGLRGGAEAAGRLMVYRDIFAFEGRVLYTYWADDLRPENRSHGVGLQAGARWAFMRGALIHVFVEDSVDRFYSSQLRLMANLDLSLLLGPHAGVRSPAGLLAAGFGEHPAPTPQPGLLW